MFNPKEPLFLPFKLKPTAKGINKYLASLWQNFYINFKRLTSTINDSTILLYQQYPHHPNMSTVFQFPRERQPELPRAAPRRTRTRYYAHRVKESLSTRFAMCICSIFLSLLIIAGVVLLVLWLSFRPHRPHFYLQSFTFNQPGSSFSFNVSDHNANQKIAIDYGDMNGSVFYSDQAVASGPVMSGFYQPPKQTTLIVGQLVATTSGPALSQIADSLKTGQVQLRFELVMTIRFEVKMWGDTHAHTTHVSCDLGLGADGNLLPNYVNERCPIYL